ncbi:NADPH-dependent F420 reductase [Lentzea sp. NPDC058450]|uniref:NADPH-dependent F420 reductase n=1 Tax=Lentzea sp. NPDC058450 TaxID=3346505 RepID=UPI0036627BC8
MSGTLALIGSGNVGGAIAKLAVDAGWTVVLSNSRGPETLAELVASLGDRATAATAEEAVAKSDLVVVSVPLLAYRNLPADQLAGKIVIDAINYYPQRDGDIAELESGELTESGLLQRALPGARVVKAFNNIVFRHLADLPRPSGSPDRATLPIAGDDESAKAEVTRLLDDLGFDALDYGTLADSWRSERDMPAYVAPYHEPAPEGLDLQEYAGWVYLTAAAAPASAEKISALLASATRETTAHEAVDISRF